MAGAIARPKQAVTIVRTIGGANQGATTSTVTAPQAQPPTGS